MAKNTRRKLTMADKIFYFVIFFDETDVFVSL